MKGSLFRDTGGSIRNGWWIGLYFTLMYFTALLLGPLYHVLKPYGYAGKGLDFLAVLLPALLCLRLQRQPLSSLGFGFGRRWLKEVLAGTLLGIAIIVLAALLVRGAGGFHWERDSTWAWSHLGLGFAIYLGVALFEETLFRGYLFQRMVDGLGPVAAQLAVAAFFAFAHWQNPGMVGPTKVMATLNIALASLLLGQAWIRTRSLALPIGIHLGWNWAQGSLLGFGVSGLHLHPAPWKPIYRGMPEWITGGEFGLEASALGTAVVGVALLGLLKSKPVATG